MFLTVRYLATGKIQLTTSQSSDSCLILHINALVYRPHIIQQFIVPFGQSPITGSKWISWRSWECPVTGHTLQLLPHQKMRKFSSTVACIYPWLVHLNGERSAAAFWEATCISWMPLVLGPVRLSLTFHVRFALIHYDRRALRAVSGLIIEVFKGWKYAHCLMVCWVLYLLLPWFHAIAVFSLNCFS